MLIEDKKAMPEDSVEALGALERILTAEQELRAGADQNGNATASEVLLKAVSGGNEISRGAVASQLIGSALLHSQSDQFAQKKQIIEQAQQLCSKRLQGLCDDAKVLGRAYATASESKSDEQSQKSMLDSLSELQEKMSQTEELAWIIQGENSKANVRQKRLNTSALVCSFLSEVVICNPAVGSLLLKKRVDLLVKADAELLADILLRSASEKAYKAVSRKIESDDPQQRVEELCSLCRNASPVVLEISDESYSLLLERVEAERVQYFQLDRMLTAVKRRSAARELCESLGNEDRVQAVTILFNSQLISEDEKQYLLNVVRQPRWETNSLKFIEAFALAIECERAAEPYCIFPEAELSPYDALLLYDVLGEYSPKTQFENEQLLNVLNQFLLLKNENRKSLLFIKKRNTEVVSDKNRDIPDMTLFRYALHEVISARKENGDVLNTIHAIKKEVVE
ncbi:hypothetical protein [Halodesulfovibrio sp. MK-HDV]|jgi:hypothetical protein|uniref:hypothetical protein n=1 Tax=Halodesulfovibrio sp. MK-HDV TaxID=2599925 RepID=UPI00136ED9DD|nr:hypothetical protein [Halodesulfovibrio sp. MK-HDV]KAF1074354.1 hypothetical protein MKHDV_02934 [Halodesulfovibrio sp. MK-HDV]